MQKINDIKLVDNVSQELQEFAKIFCPDLDSDYFYGDIDGIATAKALDIIKLIKA
jgi:hypothetical protein